MADAVADRQQELEKILTEAKRLQDYYSENDANTGKKRRWTPEDRKKFEDLSAEGFDLQQDIEAETKFQKLEDAGRRLREVPEVTMPNAKSQYKGDAPEREIAGYISLGEMVLYSDEFQKFAQGGYARGNHAIVQVAVSGMYKEVSKLAARQGVDARDFCLMPFGGAGPMLGAFLARQPSPPRPTA